MDFLTVKNKRDIILKVAEKYGAYNVRVFGSVARNEEKVNSDIDLVVNFESGRSLFDLIELKEELEELLGIKVDVISENGINKFMKDHVLQEAIPL